MISCLFLGFLAFNGGSELAIVGEDHAVVVATAFVNTIIGGASGSITAVVLNYAIAWWRGEQKYWSLLQMINGGLAGMVAMCAGCNVFHQGNTWSNDLLVNFKISISLSALD